MVLRPRLIPSLIVFAMLLIPMLVEDVMALSPHIRDGWVIGISYGYGRGKFSAFDPEVEGSRLITDWERGAVPQMRIGHVLLKNRLMLTLENRQWIDEQGILVEDKIRLNIQVWTLALTYYPGNPYSAAGGFYLQAGGGPANARVALLEPAEPNPWGEQFHEVFAENEGGTGFFAGIGYEFRVVSRVAAGLSASYVYQSIGGEIFDDAVSWPVTMTLNWYW